MSEPGVETTVSLTCQRCGDTITETSDDVDFDAEKVIEAASWGYSDDNDMALICDECQMAEG